MTVISLYGGKPKRDILELAFEEVGSAGYEFERTPEENATALRRLNMMMQEWPWSQLAYNFPIYGNGSPEEESGLEDKALSAVAYELARRLCGLWGATFSGEQRKAAAEAKAQALPAVPTMAYLAPATIRGTGARRQIPFIQEGPLSAEQQAAQIDPGNLVELMGDL